MEDLIRKYRQKGILIDTNLLILFIVGTFDVNLIEKFKRTNTYSKEDFEYLSKFLMNFKTFYFTPNILTEVTNLTDSINQEPHYSFFQHIQRVFANPIFKENAVLSSEVINLNAFLKFGLTDATNIKLSEEYLILTDDLRLHHFLVNQNLPSINFNHIRELYY